MMAKSNPKYFGARFYKCALQVNPLAYTQRHHKGNQRYKNEEDYNAEIFKQCKENNIQVVGLADHNNIKSSTSLGKILKASGITVFPGFEVESSEGIHMVCLYHEDTSTDDLEHNLRTLLGNNRQQLQLDPNVASTMSGHDIAEKVLNNQKGFWYAAHMTGKNGILRLTGSGDNHKELWKNERLLIAGQIPATLDDMDVPSSESQKLSAYKEIIENTNPDYKRDKAIVIINAKDVSDPNTLKDKSASVQIKMTTPGMESFLDAFYDPKSRVLLNHDAKESHHSKILSISWDGAGFFQENSLAFSKNLNAVIGGHGAGKSTMLESIRYALDMPPQQNDAKMKYDSLCASNLQGSKVVVKVCSAAQLENIFTISRRFGMPPEVINEDTGNVTQLRPSDILPQVEIYSQSEILRIAEDRTAQTHLLDRFLPDQSTYGAKIFELKQRLAENRERVVKMTADKDGLETELNQLPLLKEKISVFRKIGVEEKLGKLQILGTEKSIAKRINEQIQKIVEWTNDYPDLFDLDFISINTIKNLPNEGILKPMSDALQSLQSACDKSVAEIQTYIDLCRKEIGESRVALNKKHDIATDELQKALATLPDYAGRNGQQIANEIKQLMYKISSIENKQPQMQSIITIVDKLKQERRNLLKDYTDTAYKNTNELKTAIDKINEGALKRKVKISLTDASEKLELQNFFLSIGGVGLKAIKWIGKAGSVFPMELADIIRKEGSVGLLEKYKKFGLTRGIAEKIAAACHEGSEMLLELEEVEIPDSIDIQLNIAHGREKPNYHSLDKLSTGQQCTAILNIILLENQDPLIMDQPEDNLDNSFIAERIVKDLRYCKNNRQFIFATHNANIPIFGDAELIFVVEADADKVKMSEEKIGSVDKPAVREAAARILDGGREAFHMRQHKYGFDHVD